MNPEKPKTWNRITAEDRKMSQIDFERTNLPSGETSNLPLVCSPDLVFQGTFMLFPEERLKGLLCVVTYHHVVNKEVWMSLAANNELCSKLGESVRRRILLLTRYCNVMCTWLSELGSSGS